MKKYLTAILHKEEDMYVALCSELDIASQGKSIEEAKKNLEEAVELFFEVASTKECEAVSRKRFVMISRLGCPAVLAPLGSTLAIVRV